MSFQMIMSATSLVKLGPNKGFVPMTGHNLVIVFQLQQVEK